MATKQVFEAMFDWFGTEGFQVNRMSLSRVEEFAELADIQLSSSGLDGTKKKIGKWLSARDDTECVLENGQRVKLVVLRPGTGKLAALYQMKLVSSR